MENVDSPICPTLLYISNFRSQNNMMLVVLAIDNALLFHIKIKSIIIIIKKCI